MVVRELVLSTKTEWSPDPRRTLFYIASFWGSTRPALKSKRSRTLYYSETFRLPTRTTLRPVSSCRPRSNRGYTKGQDPSIVLRGAEFKGSVDYDQFDEDQFSSNILFFFTTFLF